MGCVTSRRRACVPLRVDTTKMKKEMAEFELRQAETVMGKPTLAERIRQANLRNLDSFDMEEVHVKQRIDINEMIKQQQWDELTLAIINGDELIGPKNVIGEVAKAGNYLMVTWMQEHGYAEVSGRL